jgi:hypothetical protein
LILEDKITSKTANELVEEIKKIGKNKVIFFDNNFLANENINEILTELPKIRINNKCVIFESQSGFDGRLLEKHREYAKLLYDARFKNVKIAWDNKLKDASKIENQINILSNAGFKIKDISIFMIYNYDIPYEDMLEKINYCKKWGVQIIDCRYRPVYRIDDNFNSHIKGQTDNDYHIHSESNWTDEKVKDFRKRVREHNIWIRYAKDKGLNYDINMEKWSSIHNLYKFFNMGRPPHYDIIQSSEILKNRIKKLNKLKNFYKRIKVYPPDFQKLNDKDLDETINTLCSINNLN